MFVLYRSKYPEVQCEIVFDFVEGVYTGKGVETIVDVWVRARGVHAGTWKELANGKWEGVQYRFVTSAYSCSFQLHF